MDRDEHPLPVRGEASHEAINGHAGQQSDLFHPFDLEVCSDSAAFGPKNVAPVTAGGYDPATSPCIRSSSRSVRC